MAVSVGLGAMGWGAFLGEDAVRLGPLFTGFMNALHFPCGALLAGLGYGWRRPGRWSALRPWAVLLAAVVVFGAIEWLQPYVGRSRGLGDFLNSVAGAATLTLMIECWQRRWRVLAGAVLLVGVTVLALQWWSFARAAQQVVERQRCWPMLEDFESPEAVSGWEPNAHSSLRRARHPERFRRAFPGNQHYGVLGALDATTGYAGAVHVPIVSDWREVGLLCLEVRALLPGTTLVLRLDDRHAPPYDDRFTVSLPTTPEWQRHCVSLGTLRTPKGRPLDKTRLHQLVISLPSQAGSTRAAAFDNLQVGSEGQSYLPDTLCHPGLD